MSALTAPKLALPPLYEVEQDLLALLETDGAVPEEQRPEFEKALATQLTTAVAKRDKVAGFIKQCEYAAVACAGEIQRLQARKKIFETTAERVRQYAVNVIDGLGLDEKGKLRKLLGEHFTMSARACPASVKITDEAKIPATYKRVKLDMPAETWEAISKLPGMPEPTYYTDAALLKSALESGKDIEGAELIVGKLTLVIK